MANAFVEALKVKCPKCGSEPQQGCVNAKTKAVLATVHNERLRAAGFGSAKTAK